MTMFTLCNGREFESEELTIYYRNNLHNGISPMAGYFCPKCNHEMVYIDKEYKCQKCIEEN